MLIALDPELSSHVVDEPTTVALPLADVRRVDQTGIDRATAVVRVEEARVAVDADLPSPGSVPSEGGRSADPPEEIPWLDVAGAAAYLGASESFIRKLVFERRVRHYKVGRLVRFTRDDLDDFVRGGVVEPMASISDRLRTSRRH